MSAVGDLKKQQDQLQGTSSTSGYLWRALPMAAATAAAGYYYVSTLPVRLGAQINSNGTLNC